MSGKKIGILINEYGCNYFRSWSSMSLRPMWQIFLECWSQLSISWKVHGFVIWQEFLDLYPAGSMNWLTALNSLSQQPLSRCHGRSRISNELPLFNEDPGQKDYLSTAIHPSVMAIVVPIWPEGMAAAVGKSSC